ncbi:MAG TPA: CAP domain-containing protein, partial [Nocardioides sp.]|nr:CAP domain-containing protein [Nocardioides sp.]
MRLVVALLLAALVLVGTGGTAPAQARSKAGTYAQQAFHATNANRDRQELRALRASKCLKHAAVRQARLMAQREQMFHQDIGQVLRDCGLSTVGENVAYGFPTGKSVVNDGWMNSEGHRANILNPAYRLMGIGARKGHNG